MAHPGYLLMVGAADQQLDYFLTIAGWAARVGVRPTLTLNSSFFALGPVCASIQCPCFPNRANAQSRISIARSFLVITSFRRPLLYSVSTATGAVLKKCCS